ncbi:MAG: Holliday junction resolvase RuvX [Candidatus Caccosoma sp.]|nr:Holliday junction resolvase RuvX [Candidatus Caccosoma sp.]
MKALGLDIGSVTVGIALSDSLKMFASAYSVIRYEEENDELFKQIVDIIKKEDVDVVVVGMPYHMNGDFSLGCERTRRFEEKIKQLIDIEIVEIDERMSTVTAQNALLAFDVSRKKRKQVVDKVAASVILQNYLDRRK